MKEELLGKKEYVEKFSAYLDCKYAKIMRFTGRKMGSGEKAKMVWRTFDYYSRGSKSRAFSSDILLVDPFSHL